jgi:hypothetical protein
VVIGSGFNNIDLISGSFSVSSISALSPVEILSGGTLSVNGFSDFGNGLTIDSGGTLVNAATSTDSDPILVTGLNIAAGGVLDLGIGAMDVQGGSLPAVTAQVASGYDNGLWNGNGITSSAARGDSTGLTAIGVILNNDGLGDPLYGSSTALGLFNRYDPSLNDVLVKYTYYGDANLDGKIDGSDYNRIDNGALNHLTGWINGDFNYDGAINGSDYTLIDNAFNRQGGQLDAEVAAPAAEVAAASNVAASTEVELAPNEPISATASDAKLVHKKPNNTRPIPDDEEFITSVAAMPAPVWSSTPPLAIAERLLGKTAHPAGSLNGAVDDSLLTSPFSDQPIAG